MKYLLKSGTLYEEREDKALFKIKSKLWSTDKLIVLPDDTPILKVLICTLDPSEDKHVNVRLRKYIMLDSGGTLIAEGHPDYAEGQNPDMVGWPICRMPHVDHASVQIDGKTFLLTMHNSQNYSLKDQNGKTVLQILHRGLIGGWLLETDFPFQAQILSGLFIFCRFIEQENEFLIV